MILEQQYFPVPETAYTKKTVLETVFPVTNSLVYILPKATADAEIGL